MLTPRSQTQPNGMAARIGLPERRFANHLRWGIGLLLAGAMGCGSLSPDARRAGGTGHEQCPSCVATARSQKTTTLPPGAPETTELQAMLATPWLEPARRTVVFPQHYQFTTQDGRRLRAGQLFGKPVAISFFYSRCENQNKCPLVARTMAQLQAKLAGAGLEKKTSVCLMTYDPEFDTPERLASYGTSHGFVFTPNAMILRPEPAVKRAFFRELEATVNFDRSDVNIHGIQLLLYDHRGYLARSYHTLIWNNEVVLQDLRRLAVEGGMVGER